MMGGLARILSCLLLFGLGCEALHPLGEGAAVLASGVVALAINRAWRAQRHTDARRQHAQDVIADEELRLAVRDRHRDHPRGQLLLLLPLVFLALPGRTFARPQHPAPPSHCRPHYTRKVRTIKLHNHGHKVRIREVVCVYSPPARSQASPPSPSAERVAREAKEKRIEAEVAKLRAEAEARKHKEEAERGKEEVLRAEERAAEAAEKARREEVVQRETEELERKIRETEEAKRKSTEELEKLKG
jgi:hypothetical protein